MTIEFWERDLGVVRGIRVSPAAVQYRVRRVFLYVCAAIVAATYLPIVLFEDADQRHVLIFGSVLAAFTLLCVFFGARARFCLDGPILYIRTRGRWREPFDLRTPFGFDIDRNGTFVFIQTKFGGIAPSTVDYNFFEAKLGVPSRVRLRFFRLYTFECDDFYLRFEPFTRGPQAVCTDKARAGLQAKLQTRPSNKG